MARGRGGGGVGAVDIRGWGGGGECKIESLQILDLRRLAGMQMDPMAEVTTVTKDKIYIFFCYCNTTTLDLISLK